MSSLDPPPEDILNEAMEGDWDSLDRSLTQRRADAYFDWALTEGLKDSHPHVREYASLALLRSSKWIDETHWERLIVQIRSDGDDAVEYLLAIALGRSGCRDPEVKCLVNRAISSDFAPYVEEGEINRREVT